MEAEGWLLFFFCPIPSLVYGKGEQSSLHSSTLFLKKLFHVILVNLIYREAGNSTFHNSCPLFFSYDGAKNPSEFEALCNTS